MFKKIHFGSISITRFILLTGENPVFTVFNTRMAYQGLSERSRTIIFI